MTRMWYYKLYRSARKGLPNFKSLGLKAKRKPDSHACGERAGVGTRYGIIASTIHMIRIFM
jgi:hypothetical protein